MSTAVALASARVRVPSGMASASVLPTRAAATPPPRASTTTPIACRASPAVARVARLRAAASSAPSRGALAAARASTSERDETALTEAETTEMRLGRAGARISRARSVRPSIFIVRLLLLLPSAVAAGRGAPR
jgi:hypothetical protein